MNVVCVVVNKQHYMILVFHWRQVRCEINANQLPWCCWYVEGVQFVAWSCVVSHELAGQACMDVAFNSFIHVGQVVFGG